ncbi:hypothetical protein TRFO_15461 [Tritrichomonas foetus]|uniref:CYRIA/CYRIB Rac1 binding domain-containing protein n=1 Tax=Tritrichomonas foetus TaxID=1144522 RepID=A0A1J4KSL7_9EUKA|nr:hypothetical protein TRFO_15461 [Tritrichomonas foetus]|eukprot:OHT14281.1 hypothetical protein TRFO_15461 [Tritrichomonas foetus]
MKGRFEDIEILTQHIPALIHRLDDLRDQLTGEAFILMGNNPDWARVSKYIDEKVEKLKNGQDASAPVPREIKVVMDTINPKINSIIPSIDYICNWLYYATETMKIFTTSNNLLNIRSELPLTLRVCEVFVNYVKAITVMHYLCTRVNFAWHCFTTSAPPDQVNNLTAPRQFVDVILAKISSKPFDYVSEATAPLKNHLENLTTQLSTIFSQLFAVYSLFEWSILSIEGADSLDSESTLLHSNYIVLQNLYLFYLTIVFFGLVFPQFFANNVNFGSFAISIYSESQSIRLTNSFVAPLATLLSLASESLPLKIMNTALKDIESKLTTSHPKRINCLTHLFCEYTERCNLNDDLFGLYYEQILAIYGFSFYELMIANESNIEVNMLDMLSASLDLLALIESNEQLIQRTFLYTLTSIDIGFLRDITLKCRKVSVSLEPCYLLTINSIAEHLIGFKLEDFDNGTRYDLYPLMLTHGRLISYPYTSGNDSDVSMIFSLLEHLTAIVRHLSFVESPLDCLMQIYPIHRHCYISNKIPKLIRSDKTDLRKIVSSLKFFTFIPFLEQYVKNFQQACESVCDRILRAIGDTISLKSKNVQAVLQNNMDPEFDISQYLAPPRKTQREMYEKDSLDINKCSSAMENIMTMPDTARYGKVEYKLRDTFVEKFLAWIDSYVLSGNYSPFFAASIFNMLDQVVRPFFTELNIPFIPTMLQKTRNASPLIGDEKFFSQYKLYTCQEKPKMASGFINNYIQQMTMFIESGHKTAQYEHLGLRFITLRGSTSFQAEQFFAMEPMKYLITTFGIRAGVRVNAILMSHYFVLYNQMMASFIQLTDQVNVWYQTFLRTRTIDYKAITCEQMKNCSELLLSIGLVRTLRVILGKATRQVLDEVVPSLNTIVDAGKAKLGSIGDEIAAFLESINPGANDNFLVERAKLANKSSVDAPKFLFFLGLLFANHDWDDAKFDSENDQFTHNLQLLPGAIGGLISVTRGIAEEKIVLQALAIFFKVLATIAEMKREKSRTEYANFVILVDHILVGCDGIQYGHMQNAFFFAEIRSCYNIIADLNV